MYTLVLVKRATLGKSCTILTVGRGGQTEQVTIGDHLPHSSDKDVVESFVDAPQA